MTSTASNKQDQVAAALLEYIKRYDTAAIADERRMQAFLRDLVPDGSGAIVAVVMAAGQGVPAALTSAGSANAILRKNLERTLMSECALSADAAEWAVSAWASVLLKGVPYVSPTATTSSKGAAASTVGQIGPKPKARAAPFELVVAVGDT